MRSLFSQKITFFSKVRNKSEKKSEKRKFLFKVRKDFEKRLSFLTLKRKWEKKVRKEREKRKWEKKVLLNFLFRTFRVTFFFSLEKRMWDFFLKKVKKVRRKVFHWEKSLISFFSEKDFSLSFLNWVLTLRKEKWEKKVYFLTWEKSEKRKWQKKMRKESEKRKWEVKKVRK